MWILWKGRPSVGQCKVQFPSNLFECQNRYYFFFPPFHPLPFPSSITVDPFSAFLLYIYIYISLFRIIRIDLVVASYLNLISYFFSTTVNDAVPSVPLRFSPSYRTKINLIPQFRLLVHARCVNATMLVEMYILFETRDPVVLLLFKYVNHDTSSSFQNCDPFFPFFSLHFYTSLIRF